MFCFSVPPLLFHTAAALRPNLILGEHWLNSYWFWVGLPSLICVLVGGWVGILAMHVVAILKGVTGTRLIIPVLSGYADRF